MTIQTERGRRQDLAAGLSAAEDGFTTNEDFEAAHVAAANAVFEASSGAPALSTFRAVEQSNRISQLLLDDNPIQHAIDTTEGTPWPTPYGAPNYDSYLGLDPSDGVNTAEGSSYSDELPHGLDGALGMDAPHEAIASLCGREVPHMGPLAATVTDADCIYLARGRKAPPQGIVTKRRPSNMYMGVTDYRSSFEGGELGAFTVKSRGLEKVQAATSRPLTEENTRVARALIDQSDRMADTMEKRAVITENSRRKYNVLLNRVINFDARSNQILDRIYLPNGDLRMDADPRDVRRLRMLRKKGFELGREAIRYQKTNVLATALSENALGQARLLQQMAVATAVGNKELVQVLSNAFDKFAENSVKLREKRQEQVTNWKKKPGNLEGLQGLDSLTLDAVTADYWEADLAGTQAVELAYLDEIAVGLDGFRSRFKKFVKKVKKKRPLKRLAKKVKKGVKTAARKVHKVSTAPLKFVGKKLAPRLTRKLSQVAAKARAKARSVAARIAKAANKIKTAAANKAKAAARRAAIKIKNSKFAKNTVKVLKPIGKAIKASAKIAVIPLKATVRAGKRVAKGDVRGAFKSIGKSVKDTGKSIAAVGTNLVGGLGCAVMNTRIANQVVQGVGQAVGTVYGGGTVGGAVGREVARKAHQVNQGLCKGMDELGLTGKKGINLRAKNIKRSLKVVGKDLKKKFSKEAMLESFMRIAAGAATGGFGGGAAGVATNFGTDMVKQKAIEFGKKKAIEGATKLGTKAASKIVGKKAGRILGQAAGAAAGAAGGGRFDAGAFARTQAKSIARSQGRRLGQKAATKVLGRRAGQFVATAAQVAAQGGKLDQAGLKQLAREKGVAFARRQARKQGTRLATRTFGRRAGSFVAGAAQAGVRGGGAGAQQFARGQAQQFGRRAMSRAGMPSQEQILAIARRTGRMPSKRQIFAMARQGDQRRAMMAMAQRMGRRT